METIQEKLVNFVRQVFYACDDSEGQADGSTIMPAEHVTELDRMLTEFEELPFEQEGCISGPASKVEMALAVAAAKPIDMVLHCPACGLQHIDAPEFSRRPSGAPGITLEAWPNDPHRSHLCKPWEGGCGYTWRPADVPTNGVAAVQTKGEKDSPIVDKPARCGGAGATGIQPR